MRIAIVHYWLVGMRGGEKVLETLCRMYPTADIFTHVYDPKLISGTIKLHKIQTTFINRLPFAKTMYKKYLPLMPMALEQIDLSGYDLIISSESGPAKGIVPASDATHVCYCHSPMRYIWNMYNQYYDNSGIVTKAMMPPLAHYLRAWDFATANRVDNFAANSATVGKRIKSYYRRNSEIIHPPVDTGSFGPVAAGDLGDHYLMVGELVKYKRPDLAVEACNAMKAKLVVIGGGEMLDQLRKIAGPTVQILGPQPFDVLQYHYARCKALIFPGEEDFGIVPVEAMASGRPVIAFGRGGATETVVADKTGVFFTTQTTENIIDAIERMARLDFNPDDAVSRAYEFRTEVFVDRFKSFIQSSLEGSSSMDHM
ncbi:glycosyltransferase [Rhizobium tumorigenes]|uniref:glycosyltransferase n=1 Tax=Rhizobium tumorigenes TaxID=2041385 RepID=UPI00242047C7|nr:glycosyltransferase [Rhizobium tumorigenes]WFS03320.1 glycosyltransferase [Rhizobium tumorigenes]